MDKETQVYYEDLLEMFQGKGWTSLKLDLDAMSKSMLQDSPINCDTNDKWQFRRGQLEILSYLTGYEDLMTNAFEQLKVQEDSEQGQ